MAALRASMEIFDEAGMERIRAKSVLLTGYLEYLLDQHPHKGLSVITPRDPEQRGAQLSLAVSSNGKALYHHLASHGVVCDWREPDVIRVAPAPLYNTFMDVYEFVERLVSWESL
jgi:kynureninase